MLADAPANLPTNDAMNAPLLQPYPNWAAHEMVNADDIPDIVSPFHIKVDRCGRLWAIDIGVDEAIKLLHDEEPKRLAEPQILIYNLTSDNLIRKFQLPKAAVSSSIYSNIVVDDSASDCDDAFAFVANAGANKPKLIVYSLKANESWSVEHNFFHLDPLAGNFSVLGVDYQTSDALYGLTLTEKKQNGFPDLYFHALSSYKEFKVSTSILRNKSLFGTIEGQGKYFKDFVEVGTRATNEQAGASTYDKSQNIVFYTLPNKNEVACWKASNKDKYGVDSVFSSPGYPVDVKVDDQEQVWILSNNMHQFLRGEFNAQNTANFYIHEGPASELVKNTRCELGFIDKLKKKLNKNGSYTIQPATVATLIGTIALSLSYLF